jgi:secreted trypsin-like serine protease
MRRTIVLLTTMAMTLLAATSVAMAVEGGGGPTIIGGTEVPNGKYRFVVALLDKTRGDSESQPESPQKEQFCGGSLLNKDTVLTAAHCVDDYPRKVVATDLRVLVGETHLNSLAKNSQRPVVSIHVHPKWDGTASKGYDVAVLKVSSAVPGFIRPTTIRVTPKYNNVFETEGRSLTVAGWGNTEALPPPPYDPQNIMREAQVPVVSDDTAEESYKSAYVPELMVAAGELGIDTCQGDSGGPLFTKVSTSTGVVYYQVGITSFGKPCGVAAYGGVYTEVNNPGVFDFIHYWAVGPPIDPPS